MDRETARATVDWLRRVIQEELRAEWESVKETKRQQIEHEKATRGQANRRFFWSEPSIRKTKIAGRVLHRTTEPNCPIPFRQLPANAAEHRIYRQLNWLCQFGLVEAVQSHMNPDWTGYRPINILDALARAADDAPSDTDQQ